MSLIPLPGDTLVGLLDSGGFRGYLDAFDRRDLLPDKFDRAFAGVTEPGGSAVYNVDAVLAILGGSAPLNPSSRARLLSDLDDLNNTRLYKDKGREVVFVSFGVAVCPSPRPKPPAASQPPASKSKPTKAGPKRKK